MGRGKQSPGGAREGRSEALDDLSLAEILLVRVCGRQIQVELIGRFWPGTRRWRKVRGRGARVFFDAMHGFDVALLGVSARQDMHVYVDS
jgi:hypothetical protein